MRKQDYIPRREGNLIKWLVNYRGKLPGHAAALGLDDAAVEALQNECGQIIEALQANEKAQHAAQKARSAADTQKKTSLSALRKAVKKQKTRDDYKNSIGVDLGIIGAEQGIDKNTAQPKLKVRKTESGWELSFNLMGFFDAVKIYRKRPGEGKKFLMIDFSSPYVDTEPQVNGTSYTAWFLLGDETAGIESDAVLVQL